MGDTLVKIREYTDLVTQRFVTEDWSDWAKLSIPYAAWSSIGLSIFTLFVFHHVISSAYGLLVGLLIGIMSIQVIYENIPRAPYIRGKILGSGLDSPGSKGLFFVFSSIGFFMGPVTPLYFAGVAVFLSGLCHLFEVFIGPVGDVPDDYDAENLSSGNRQYSTFQQDGI